MSRKTRLEIDEKSIALLSFSARKDCEECRVFFHQDLPVGKGQFYSLPSPISIVIPTKVIDDADVITMSLELSKYAFFFTEEIKLSANDRITH